ncbi:MAG: tetratricopeptide repeat protein, partial [Gammaproteobacteria bacterium]|nr:tetratricopeptide repeat protein [Gammaproteobacteria bacterium]
ITLMAGVLAWQAGDLREQRDRAEREAARARSASNLLLGSIRAANPLVGEGGQLTVADLLDATTQRATSELDDDPVLLAETLIHIGDARRGLGQHALGLPLYGQALQLLEHDPAHDVAAQDRLRLNAVLGQVEALRATEQVQAALERANEARAGMKTTTSLGHLNVGLARAHLGLGQHDAAEPLLREALIQIPESETVAWARAAADLGFIHMSRGEYEETLRWLDRARRDLGGAPAERALLASILGNSSYALAQLGRLDEGLVQVEQAVAMRIEAYGESHVSTVVALLDQAYVLNIGGRWDEAAQVLRRAIGIEAALGDGNTRRMERLQSLLGDVLRHAGHTQEALEPLHESVRIAALLFPEDSYLRASPHGNYAGALADAGNCESALEHSRIARELYLGGSGGGARRGAAITASNLADCHARLGQAEQALHWADTALAEAEHLPDAQTGHLARIRLVRATVLKHAGRLDEAMAEVQEAGRGLDAATTAPPLSARRTRFTLLAELHEALGDAEAAQNARMALEALEAET